MYTLIKPQNKPILATTIFCIFSLLSGNFAVKLHYEPCEKNRKICKHFDQNLSPLIVVFVGTMHLI